MTRYFSLFAQYAMQYAKVRMEYRWDFFISVLTMTLATVFGLAVVFLIFGPSRGVGDWSFSELLFLYGFSLLPMSLFNVISVNLYQFSEVYLIQGKFDRVLLRPVHPLFQILFEQLRFEMLGDAVLGLFLMTTVAPQLHLHWGPAAILFLAIAVICGGLIYTAIFVTLASVSFWYEDKVGVMPPIYNLIAFGRYPLDIYNGFVRVLLSWVVPFGFAAFYPTAAVLRSHGYLVYAWLLPVVTAVFCLIAVFVWNRGMRNYSSTGG
jgi:ABC-2 type transport system permease protein